MLDAQPAANAPARLPAIQPIPASPAITDALSVRSKLSMAEQKGTTVAV